MTSGGYVILPPDNDADTTNELQLLSLSNDTLYLTSGGYVVLPPDSDADATNELQVLSNTPGTISISNGNTISIQDSSSTNELQALSLSNDTLYLSKGNYVVLPPDSDGDATNELQTLSITGNDLDISNGNTVSLPQDGDSDATNEIQTLNILNNNLALSGSNSVSLPVNNDNSSTNELQTLTYNNDTLSISNGNNVTISSSNFDFIYPDGKSGITPINLSTPGNDVQVPFSAWQFVESQYELSYTPPTGKNLYITSLNSNYYTYSTNSGFNSRILLNTDIIYSGGGYQSNSGEEDFNHMFLQPLIVGSNDALKITPLIYNYTTYYKIYSSNITGFLIDANVIPFTLKLENNNSYTVPSGKIFVILNICSYNLNSGSSSVNYVGSNTYPLKNNGNDIASGKFNNYNTFRTSFGNSSSYHYLSRGISLTMPIFINENDVLTHPNPNNGYFMTLNGYLMDK